MLVWACSDSSEVDDPAEPPEGSTEPTLCSDPSTCLEQLAGTTRFDDFKTSADGSGGAGGAPPDYEIGLSTFVWSTRAFAEKADYYFFTQYFRSTLSDAVSTNTWQNSVILSIPPAGSTPRVVTFFPATSTCMDEEININQSSLSGQLGFNTKGLVASVSGAFTWGNQYRVICPQMNIDSVAEASGIMEFIYTLGSRAYSNEAFLMIQQWGWRVPWSDDMPVSVSLAMQAVSDAGAGQGLSGTFTHDLPIPFDATSTSIPKPTLTSAVPMNACRGAIITLTGTNLFSTAINQVQIAGEAVPTWEPLFDGNNTTVYAVVPLSQAVGENQLVGVGVGTNFVTGPEITINETCDVGGAP